MGLERTPRVNGTDRTCHTERAHCRTHRGSRWTRRTADRPGSARGSPDSRTSSVRPRAGGGDDGPGGPSRRRRGSSVADVVRPAQRLREPFFLIGTCSTWCASRSSTSAPCPARARPRRCRARPSRVPAGLPTRRAPGGHGRCGHHRRHLAGAGRGASSARRPGRPAGRLAARPRVRVTTLGGSTARDLLGSPPSRPPRRAPRHRPRAAGAVSALGLDRPGGSRPGARRSGLIHLGTPPAPRARAASPRLTAGLPRPGWSVGCAVPWSRPGRLRRRLLLDCLLLGPAARSDGWSPSPSALRPRLRRPPRSSSG